MLGIHIFDFVDKLPYLNRESIGILTYTGLKNNGSSRYSHLISLESKFLHWSSEVSYQESLPIYDNNVKNELKIAKKHYFKNYNNNLFDDKVFSKIPNEFEKFNLKIICYIKNYLLQDPDVRIPLKIDRLHNEVSIYRLVDKFLWLNNKLRNLDIKLQHNTPLNENEKQLNDIFFNHYIKWTSSILK